MTPHCAHCVWLGIALALPIWPLLIVGALYLHVCWGSYMRRQASKARQVRSRQVDAYFSRPGGDA